MAVAVHVAGKDLGHDEAVGLDEANQVAEKSESKEIDCTYV